MSNLKGNKQLEIAKNTFPNNLKNYKMVLTQLHEVEKHYQKAARYFKDGNHKKAHKNFVFALGYCCMARELMREDAGASINRNLKLKTIR
jgi:hypothetical protein